jgi:hypothetical protein
MGLDLVEMVCRIEEEFEVIISDEVAVTFVTPRTVIDYLMTQPNINGKLSRDYIALSVWLMLEDEVGINRANYNEDSRFIEDMGLD